MRLGRGVAYRVESPELTALRDELAEAFAGLLVPQDQGRPRFHITVQNKVEPAEAKALADELRRAFRPRPLAIAGLAAWHYRGGRSEEHTSELQSLMRISYAVFCLKKKKQNKQQRH